MTRAQELVRELIDEHRLVPKEISELLNNRVSPRTIYRWGKGETEPGNSHDLDALTQLVETRRS